DHIIPKHLGGGYSWENLVTACAKCNHHKGGRSRWPRRSDPPASAR
ncbi:MAG TPA: HNH endonuclease, partial [Anaerolineae bacterium]|nr:HNH endonuclease [Anaerolineae bacterium]